MLHHVSVGVSNIERAAKFYDAALGALGYWRVMEFPGAIAYGERNGDPQFWIGTPHDQNAASAGNGTHIGFTAPTKNAVLKFHAAALEQGGSNNGEPGPRPDYGDNYYGAFVYDLDGNKIEATLISAPVKKAKPKSKAKVKAKAAKAPAKKAKAAAKKPVKAAAKKKKKKARAR